MAQTTARIKKAGKHFEILVDLDEALKFKKGETASVNLEIDKIFSDAKKGEVAPSRDLKSAFKTEDVYEIAQEIIPKYQKYNKIMELFFIPPSLSWCLTYCLKLEQEGKIQRTRKGKKIVWSI